MKPTCEVCGGLGWVDSYGHVRHDAPGAYDHLFKRRRSEETHLLSFSTCVRCYTNISRKDDGPWLHRDDIPYPGHTAVPLS